MNKRHLPIALLQAVFALGLAAALPAQAFAWGYVGHSMINHLGAENLPASLPDFVRSKSAVEEITRLGPEPDVLKGAGKSWDSDNDEGHFLDIGDDGTVAGVVQLSDLPPSMEAYTLLLEKAGTDPYKMGYAPYSIMDGFEQVRQDFAYWRVFNYMAIHATDATERAKYVSLRTLREDLTLHDIGYWGHFVGDGCQPLHITIHYNGWGDYPNPNNYTTEHIHSFFESTFVNKYAKADDVKKLVKPYTTVAPTALLSQTQIADMVGQYLLGTAAAVPPLYKLYAAGNFQSGAQNAIDFTDAQLARGATEYTMLISLAWDDSMNASVGYPETSVRDALGGTHINLDF